jgi:hypothetical protein
VLRNVPPTTYSYPHGQCRSVGVGGYLLGGGVNWLGTYNKYGYGAENVLAMRAVLSDGRIADVTPEKTEVECKHVIGMKYLLDMCFRSSTLPSKPSLTQLRTTCSLHSVVLVQALES